MRSIAVVRWFAARPHFTHVRTKIESLGTNGVIERFFQSIKYEHLYRRSITDGVDLAAHTATFVGFYNRIRPHETIGMGRPADRFRQPQPTEKGALNLSNTLDTGQKHVTIVSPDC